MAKETRQQQLILGLTHKQHRWQRKQDTRIYPPKPLKLQHIQQWLDLQWNIHAWFGIHQAKKIKSIEQIQKRAARPNTRLCHKYGKIIKLEKP